MLRDSCAYVLVGTPVRELGLLRDKDLRRDKQTQFWSDESDKCLERSDMRKDVQQLFAETPAKKQVMKFSATMIQETRALGKRLSQALQQIRVDAASELTLHGLLPSYDRQAEREKSRQLNDLLDASEFNQAVIFARSVQRAEAIDADGGVRLPFNEFAVITALAAWRCGRGSEPPARQASTGVRP